MIRWSRVTELREEVGHDDFTEVVDLFLEEVGDVIEKLRRTDSSIDLEQELHFLKGSALSLGFEHFSDLCQDGENRAAGGRAVDVDLPAIINSFDESKVQFQNELPSRFPA